VVVLQCDPAVLDTFHDCCERRNKGQIRFQLDPPHVQQSIHEVVLHSCCLVRLSPCVRDRAEEAKQSIRAMTLMAERGNKLNVIVECRFFTAPERTAAMCKWNCSNWFLHSLTTPTDAVLPVSESMSSRVMLRDCISSCCGKLISTRYCQAFRRWQPCHVADPGT